MRYVLPSQNSDDFLLHPLHCVLGLIMYIISDTRGVYTQLKCDINSHECVNLATTGASAEEKERERMLGTMSDVKQNGIESLVAGRLEDGLLDITPDEVRNN